MREDWLQTKLVNPRTNEGKPQTEALKYARELFEAFGMEDPRFSGAVVVGSTMKGYGLESSDIDVVPIYYEIPRRRWIPKREHFPGIIEPAAWEDDIYTFLEDLDKFQKRFKTEREQGGKKNFDIDMDPDSVNLTHYLGIDSLGKVSIAKNNLLPAMFAQLSFPIMETKNPNAIMPMEKVLSAIREAVTKLDNEEKRRLLENIRVELSDLSRGSFNKYSGRIGSTVDKKQYVEARWKMLQQRLKSKFGLFTETEN
jgi:hypothetical protein